MGIVRYYLRGDRLLGARDCQNSHAEIELGRVQSAYLKWSSQVWYATEAG